MTLIVTTNGQANGTAAFAAAVPAPEHPFDNLENWGKEWTFTPPLPRHEIKNWQERFDRAFGVNRDGKSCFKLVWSGDRSYWWKFFYDWNAYGKGTKIEERPRILWKKVNIGNGDYVDLFPPRWLILMRIEPEQYRENWKAESWAFDPKRGPQGQMKQIRDDAVPNVFWETFEVIGEHDEFCCELFKGECFGAFRNPQEKDLIRLGELKRTFEAGHQSPYEKLNARTEAEIARFTREYYTQQYTKMPASTEIVIEQADAFLKPLLDFTGENYTDREKKAIVKNALNRHYSERADEYEAKLKRD